MCNISQLCFHSECVAGSFRNQSTAVEESRENSVFVVEKKNIVTWWPLQVSSKVRL